MKDLTQFKGILPVYKPTGITSHDVVDQVRKLTGERRVGHAGTLDPFAEGLLILLVGREYTKRQAGFLGMDKTYEATVRLGARSTTEDPEGEITETPDLDKIPREEVESVIMGFVGEQDQMPSTFSAKKINGKKAYELARKGEAFVLQPKRITIHSIEILDYTWPELRIRVSVSSGTYIRALARDIGEKLDCGAYLTKLKRTQVGSFDVKDALRLEG